MTKAGPIDIVFAPDGAPSGYADLADDAVSAELDHQPVWTIRRRIGAARSRP